MAADSPNDLDGASPHLQCIRALISIEQDFKFLGILYILLTYQLLVLLQNNNKRSVAWSEMTRSTALGPVRLRYAWLSLGFIVLLFQGLSGDDFLFRERKQAVASACDHI